MKPVVYYYQYHFDTVYVKLLLMYCININGYISHLGEQRILRLFINDLLMFPYSTHNIWENIIIILQR